MNPGQLPRVDLLRRVAEQLQPATIRFSKPQERQGAPCGTVLVLVVSVREWVLTLLCRKKRRAAQGRPAAIQCVCGGCTTACSDHGQQTKRTKSRSSTSLTWSVWTSERDMSSVPRSLLSFVILLLLTCHSLRESHVWGHVVAWSHSPLLSFWATGGSQRDCPNL